MGARRILAIGVAVAAVGFGGMQAADSAERGQAAKPQPKGQESPLPKRKGKVVEPGSVRAALRHVRTADMDRPLRIMVTNDDGIGAAGIDAVVEGLRRIPNAEVVVVAPAANQSGSSDTYTEDNLLVTDGQTASGRAGKAVHGKPADSVFWAVKTGYYDPDIVVSGINFGQNFGDAVTLSGTVGAATTAARLGIPAVAVSQGIPATDYSEAADIATVFVAWVGPRLVNDPPPAGIKTVTNINVPDCGRINGVVAVPVGRLRTHDGFVDNGDGTFAPQFVDREFGAFDCDSGATTATDDIDAFNKGLVGVTLIRPLLSDL